MMKLSEAIRAGAKLHPQGFGDYVIYVDDEPRTCAIGAAYEAITGNLPYRSEMNRAFHVVDTIQRTCEVDNVWFDRVLMWNDQFHFTREYIASQLETYGQ